jgi:hypothetical protein
MSTVSSASTFGFRTLLLFRRLIFIRYLCVPGTVPILIYLHTVPISVQGYFTSPTDLNLLIARNTKIEVLVITPEGLRYRNVRIRDRYVPDYSTAFCRYIFMDLGEGENISLRCKGLPYRALRIRNYSNI